jgi:hypothetical protein
MILSIAAGNPAPDLFHSHWRRYHGDVERTGIHFNLRHSQ